MRVKSGEGANFLPLFFWIRDTSPTVNNKNYLTISTIRKCRPESGAPTSIFLGVAVQTPVPPVLVVNEFFGR